MRTEFIILAIVCVVLSATYWKGRSDCAIRTETKILKEIVFKDAETRKSSEKVKKHVQSLDEIQLDRELCVSGIVRANNGCQ